MNSNDDEKNTSGVWVVKILDASSSDSSVYFDPSSSGHSVKIHFARGVTVNRIQVFYYSHGNTSLSPTDVKIFELYALWDGFCDCDGRYNVCEFEEVDPNQIRKAASKPVIKTAEKVNTFINQIVLKANANFAVFDYSGKRVEPKLEKVNSLTWQVRGLPPGLYFVVTENGERTKFLVR